MRLYYSKASPFTRKVLITAAITGHREDIEIIDFGKTGTFAPSEDFHEKNPLIKIPALEIDNDETIIDSAIICEYLNDHSKTDSRVYPKHLELRDYYLAKKLEAIADGIADAAVLRRYEVMRPEQLRSQEYDQKQKAKIENGLIFFEKNMSLLKTDRLMIGEISLICCLDYLNLRFPEEKWLEKSFELKKWYNSMQSMDPIKKTAS